LLREIDAFASSRIQTVERAASAIPIIAIPPNKRLMPTSKPSAYRADRPDSAAGKKNYIKEKAVRLLFF
jgi:hypothetical protein